MAQSSGSSAIASSLLPLAKPLRPWIHRILRPTSPKPTAPTALKKLEDAPLAPVAAAPPLSAFAEAAWCLRASGEQLWHPAHAAGVFVHDTPGPSLASVTSQNARQRKVAGGKGGDGDGGGDGGGGQGRDGLGGGKREGGGGGSGSGEGDKSGFGRGGGGGAGHLGDGGGGHLAPRKYSSMSLEHPPRVSEP